MTLLFLQQPSVKISVRKLVPHIKFQIVMEFETG